jgi:serine/threonine-protein kinase HipA
MKQGLVLCGRVLAGRIERSKHGAVFEYDAGFLEAARTARREQGIAYGLPLDAARVETLGTNLHPFFAGLLPEGIRLDALVRRVKSSRDDLLSLLMEAGADCIGDVHVVPDGKAPTVHRGFDFTRPETLRFSDILRESLAGKHGIEPTLPGVQDKVSAAKLSLPVRGQTGAEYIMKLNPQGVPKLVENEHFFLRMAGACGLITAKAALVRDADGAAGLLVQRFDRIPVKKGDRVELHQEDACQFLERYPSDKYLLSCSEIARGIQSQSSAPMVEVAKLIRLVAFSYLIANGDLHAKNISLRTVGNTIGLTPAYDLLSSLPYGDRSMALEFDGKTDNIKRKGIVAFGVRHGVRAAASESILDELCDVAPTWISELGEIGLEPKKTADLTRVMRKRSADIS